MSEFIVPGYEAVKTDKILLVDADFIKYFVIANMASDIKEQRAIVFNDPIVHYTEANIRQIKEKVEAKAYLFCFSGVSTNTFRSSVAFDKEYKGNRSGGHDYEQSESDKIKVIEYIKKMYPTLLFVDLEADDIISMLQDDDTMIFSHDKDLKQIPGLHFNQDTNEIFKVSQNDALRFLMYQLVTGDTVDNIRGIDGYGPKKLEQFGQIKTKQLPYEVMRTYIHKYGYFEGLDRYVETYNLCKLRMNRGEHFKNKYKHAFDTLEMLKLI